MYNKYEHRRNREPFQELQQTPASHVENRCDELRDWSAGIALTVRDHLVTKCSVYLRKPQTLLNLIFLYFISNVSFKES